MKWTEIKPQVDEVEFPDGKKLIVLTKGRLVNLGNAHRPSQLRHVARASPTRCSPRSSCGPAPTSIRTTSTSCPSISTKRSLALHLDKLGVKLTKLNDKQATYIGVPPEGPFKPDHYRYYSAATSFLLRRASPYEG